jgi:hypothetical protein
MNKIKVMMIKLYISCTISKNARFNLSKPKPDAVRWGINLIQEKQ